MAARKRKSAPAAEVAPTTPEPPARRRSQRVSLSGQKSKYFEAESDPDARDETSSKKGRGRGRPPKKVKVAEPEPESDEDGDDYKEEAEAKAVEQSADDTDDEFDEDAPPKVTFIPLPQLRKTGGIEYADDRLHPNTLAFLKDLKANNKRAWLKCKPFLYPLPAITV